MAKDKGRNHWCKNCGATYYRELPPEECRYCVGGNGQFKSQSNLDWYWMMACAECPGLQLVADVLIVQLFMIPLALYHIFHQWMVMTILMKMGLLHV